MMNIYVAGPIGYETAARMYEGNRDYLESRFAGFFLKQFERIAGERLTISDISADGACEAAAREITEGGLFRALWELGEELKCGLTVELEAIPVRQEVIEILELFKESPYECSSRGSFVFAADSSFDADAIFAAERSFDVDGFFAVEQDSDADRNSGADRMPGIVRVGQTTDSAARLICSKYGERYLTPPSRQEKDILDRRTPSREATE